MSEKAKIHIFSGVTQTGKTTKAMQLLKTLNKKTVFVWDIDAQWCEIKGFKKITTLAEFWEICKAGKAGNYALVYTGDIRKGFETMCKMVFHYAYWFGDSVFIAEELADVTGTGKAGQEWGLMVRRGLKRGLSIIAISQRWQEADKTALGNAWEFFVFAPSTINDAKYIANLIGCTVSEVMQLQPFEYLHWQKFSGYKHVKLQKK